MVATLIASWQRVAEGSEGASVERIRGATAGRFPTGAERGIYNNAVLERGLDESAAAETVGAAAAPPRGGGGGGRAPPPPPPRRSGRSGVCTPTPASIGTRSGRM